MAKRNWTLQLMQDWLDSSKHKNAVIKNVFYKKTKSGNKLCVDIVCENGHNYAGAYWDSIIRDHWCKECFKKWNIDNMQDYLNSNHRGAKIQSVYYNKIKNSKKLYVDIICENGHIYNKVFWSHVLQGKWCNQCNIINSRNRYVPPEIKQLRSLNVKNRYILLGINQLKGLKFKDKTCLNPEEYQNSKSANLKWECEKGHVWNACLNNIKNNNRGCPECKERKYEKTTIEIVENLLNIKLETQHSVYTNGTDKKPQYFDGYSKEHNLAIEYNGDQHYRFIKYWHKTEEGFKLQQERDNRKRQYCKDNNITLIEIPYTVKYNNLEEYIKNQLLDYIT